MENVLEYKFKLSDFINRDTFVDILSNERDIRKAKIINLLGVELKNPTGNFNDFYKYIYIQLPKFNNLFYNANTTTSKNFNFRISNSTESVLDLIKDDTDYILPEEIPLAKNLTLLQTITSSGVTYTEITSVNGYFKNGFTVNSNCTTIIPNEFKNKNKLYMQIDISALNSLIFYYSNYSTSIGENIDIFGNENYNSVNYSAEMTPFSSTENYQFFRHINSNNYGRARMHINPRILTESDFYVFISPEPLL